MTRVTCKIKDVISEVKSGDWGKGSPTENYTTEVLCVRGADIPELCKGNVGKMPQRFIHNKKATSKILSANNLIIEISGGSPTQSTGRIALISDKILSRYSKPLICSNFCKAIIATGIQPEYLFNYWLYLYNKDAMFPYENGTTGIKNLDFNSFIQEQDISIPDIKTQQKIVSILSSIDEKIETNKRINDNLEEQAKALFKSWFVDFEPFKGGKFVDSELGLIPKGWSTGTIYSYIDVIYGAPYKSALFNDKKQGLPLIRIRDLKTYTPQYYTKEVLPNTEYVECGDIIAGMDAEFIPHIWRGEKGVLNQRLCKFVPKYDYVSKYYIYSLVYPKLAFVQSYKVGTTVSHLGKADIDRFKVIVPPEDIIMQYSFNVNSYFAEIVKVSNENQILSSLRDTLLPKLMSGELSVEEVSLD